MAEIEFDDVTKRYSDGYEAVKHFNLDVSDGELMILVGPSGCGKSTALRMVAGLEDISGGELKIDGQVVNEKAPKDRDIAMVFQNYALYPHMTVRENMGFALKLAHVPDPEIHQKVTEAAKILDLEQHLDRKPANLSGGQRQRVAMGRAIVRNPKAFLMDEPLSNLDAKLRVQMRTEIARIQHNLNTTTIYVTHDQTEAMTLGDRIAVMRLGVLQQVGRPTTLYNNPTNLFVAGFIGSPSMNFLPGELNGDQLQLPIGTVQIPGSLRRQLESGPGGGRKGIVAGIRPEDFEDASLVSDRAHGHTFKTKIDVLEAMGSEYFAYFVVESEGVSSSELDEIAQDAGSADLPSAQGGTQIVARLDAASRVREHEETELWFNTDHLHLFDLESGRTLLGDGAGPDGDQQATAGREQPPAAPEGESPAGGSPAGEPPTTGSPTNGRGAPAQGAGCASLAAPMATRPVPRPPKAEPKPRRRYARRMPPEKRREQLIDAALSVILEQGYEGVSIEAIAREAGVTRPVIYDHFPNLGRLLHALIEREERYALDQLAQVVPDSPGEGDLLDVLAGTVRRFLDAVSGRPATWRIILLPLEGTPTIVREHVEIHRKGILERIEQLVRWAIERGELPAELDIELIARAIRDLGEEAGRMVLTDPDRYSPDRYERFVQSVVNMVRSTNVHATSVDT